EGCPHCSFWADHFDSVNIHIGQRDTSFAVISRAPVKEIEPFQKRMGWRFKWLSSFNTDFNFDFNVSFTPEQLKNGKAIYNYAPLDMNIDEREGVNASTSGTDVAGYLSEGHGFSVFVREVDNLYHSYSTYTRGTESLMGYYGILDRTPKGRNEDDCGPMTWLRLHDEYGKGASKACCG